MSTRVGIHVVAALALAFAANAVVAEEAKLPGEPCGDGRLVQLNDMSMYYEVRGKGPPLVLLHGFFGTGQWQWRAYIAEFAKDHRVIVPDLRGHGRSTNPSGQLTNRRLALDIYALMDAMEIKRFRAFGLSTGGVTLLHMATQQPDRIEAMVLNGMAQYCPTETRHFFTRVTYDDLPGVDRALWHSIRTLHGEEKMRALVKQFNKCGVTYDDMNFTPPYLATIKARTLIVHGDRDEQLPVHLPVEMYRSIPNSYLWIVPNGGHGPFFDPNPDLTEEKAYFAKKVKAFLRGDWEKDKKPRK